jgi:hypothetical protein
VEKLIASINPTQLSVILRVGLALTTQMGSFPVQLAKVVLRQVHDGVSQIGREGLGLSEILESSKGTHEGVLGQILGQVSVPCEEVSEPNDVR